MVVDEALTLGWLGEQDRQVKGLRTDRGEGFLEAVPVELDFRGRERCGKGRSLDGRILLPLLDLSSDLGGQDRHPLSPPGAQ